MRQTIIKLYMTLGGSWDWRNLKYDQKFQNTLKKSCIKDCWNLWLKSLKLNHGQNAISSNLLSNPNEIFLLDWKTWIMTINVKKIRKKKLQVLFKKAKMVLNEILRNIPIHLETIQLPIFKP